MKLLILDTETSSLDPADGHLLEVGVVVWSVTHCSSLSSAAWLLRAPSNAAAEINGIPEALLEFGSDRDKVLEFVTRMASSCDAIAAHNDFDRQWLPDLGRPWIDTAWDVDWPRGAGGRKLHELCLAHGLAVLDAHRALPDCQLLARLFERVAEMGCDVTELVRRALRPKAKVISLAPFAKKDLVKQHGFRWDPVAKVWWRNMAREDVAALPFSTKEAA